MESCVLCYSIAYYCCGASDRSTWNVERGWHVCIGEILWVALAEDTHTTDHTVPNKGPLFRPGATAGGEGQKGELGKQE